MKALLLELDNLFVHYKKIAAVKGVSIGVEEGQIVTLIGANGAGKTTTLRAISGLERPSAGEILFRGQRIGGAPPERIAELGIAHVPEGRRVFRSMTVRENLEMGAFLRKDHDTLRLAFVDVFARFPRLRERETQMAGTLSGGEQQMLAMGRALMANPSVILMDEPSLGLSPIMCREIAKIIRSLHQEGRTIVLVEQNARLALALAQWGYVMETGRIALEGPAMELRENDEVQHTYLGMAASKETKGPGVDA
jgi:branched-chain amino acid transport system ATP-binding protein